MPGQRGNLHVHDVDTAIFSLTGRVVAVFETNGRMHEVESPAHTALFVPANTPHAPINPSATEEYHYVVFRPGQRD